MDTTIGKRKWEKLGNTPQLRKAKKENCLKDTTKKMLNYIKTAKNYASLGTKIALWRAEVI